MRAIGLTLRKMVMGKSPMAMGMSIPENSRRTKFAVRVNWSSLTVGSIAGLSKTGLQQAVGN